MAETKSNVIKGGSFLVEDISSDRIYTPEEFTEEHKMIGKTTEDYIQKDVAPHIEEIENHQFDLSLKLLKKAGELGLLGADVPEKYGGIDLDKISSSIITEKFALAGSFSLSYGAHVGIGSLPIVFFGNEAQKKKYLPDLASGEKIAAYALTEPGSGSDALGAKTVAKLNDEGTHYILNGEKQWITNAGFADVFIVYAKIDGDKFTAFIVERDLQGVSTGPEEKKMGIKGSSTRTLILEDVVVPKENVLGEIGKGHIIAFNILNIGRYKLAVGCVGGCKRAIEISAQYANERQQFKLPIAKFTIIQQKLADMAIQTYATESSVYRTVGLFEDSLSRLSEEQLEDGQETAKAIADYALECSLNKVFASEALDFVADEAVQIHGGYGFMSEYEVETIYRNSRINRIFEGTNEINRLLVPATIMRKAMKGELPLMEKATALQEELLMMMPEQPGDSPLEREKAIVSMSKKVFLMAAGLAVQKYGEKLEREQEVLANIADIVSEIYAMESCLLRAEKELNKGENADLKIKYTEVFCQESMDRIERFAKQIILATEEGDMKRMMLSALRKLTRYEPMNVISTKREIASLLLKSNKYLV
ncbi:acyl-CoA dehydrogenase [Lottiidibacillus patelloidae]|uniref:Acyl-CoA dehydrogenase n=1 Tax=Lottiidibacillus patelloidae TaxID=2670334 RepID=A0A263BS27_9BACI|nr:acyl-CoA dehydrogenase family protein [Lottiidibacillus patelloidae]OZM55996.1 acyl-CoA dehydrogenase [Lottiidibacillus patelloidae]